MKHHKGYPYREKKKQRTKVDEDRRPHVAVRMPLRGWVRRSELEAATGGTDFHIPNLKYIEDKGRPSWTRQEAHSLIDMYAQIAWAKKPEYRKEMAKLAGHFINLFDRQEGLCAITKLPLLGAPGMLYYGIGIDLLQKKRGPVKGNIRLVSCPLALTRYRWPVFATQQIELPRREHYPNQDITYALAHNLYWYIDKRVPFKHLPVTVEFRKEKDISGNDGRYMAGFIEFVWSVALPTDVTWQAMNVESNRFFKVRLLGDVLDLEGTDKIVERRLPLTDPSIDFEKEICEEALRTLKRGLHIKFRGESRRYY